MTQEFPKIIPKISFVVAARNDNYGGDFSQRMQKCIDVLLTLTERYRLNSELVIVEWNPPKNNPPLSSALSWGKLAKYCSVRIITVSEEVHRTIPNSDRLPLFEFLAKNVGVRRSKGKFILVTNPDILFTGALIQFLAENELSERCFYRATRYDVLNPMPEGLSFEELLFYCERHVTRINAWLGSYDNTFRERFNIGRIAYSILDYLTWRMSYFPYERPFTNASGDFLMVHCSHWYSLYGYPQVFGADIHGRFHIDSFMVIEALFSGLKQIRLGGEKIIYHQEHNRPDYKNLFSEEIDSTRDRLLKARKPLILNDENWGLGAYQLPEILIS
jgi:hypothetical protein